MTAPLDSIRASVSLSNGSSIPRLGLGVWQTARGATTINAVRAALATGYRHIDTASIYGNEADVGAGLAQSGVPRDQVFVTTKLWNADQGYDRALRAFDRSLSRLGLEYLDLYLIHWPLEERWPESWRALERIAKEGRARAIGVSNFLRPHLMQLAQTCELPPAVDQIELSPFLQRADTVTYCLEHGIALQAYSPLTHGKRLDHPVLREVATRVSRTAAQVLIRWSLQRGFIVLPKSANPERIAQNAAVFDFQLDPAAMTALDALEEGLVTGWDPATEA